MKGLDPRRHLLLACSFIMALAGNAIAADTASAQTFTLREESVFDQKNDRFFRGQSISCQDQSRSEAKLYPKFTSAKPLFGSMTFFGEHSGPRTANSYLFAIDESKGTGKGYDRFYFDLNNDKDLSNDTALKPQERPPEAARLKYSSIKDQVLFEVLDVPFDFGPAGKRSVGILPRLTKMVYEGEQPFYQVSFVRTKVYTGDIKINGREFRATLGNDRQIFGRLDEPGTCLLLDAKPIRSGRNSTYWWLGGDRLSATHKVGGKFFSFSASPTGDELAVKPYTGEFGAFEVGPGDRKIDKLSISGAFRSKTTAVPVGGEVVDGSPAAERQCQLPVGDYLPGYVGIEFGRLSIDVSDNYHGDGGRRVGDKVYEIAIRKEKPFVMDFSGKPVVIFASPGKDSELRRGEELDVRAVLVDPKLDIMIRRLYDNSRKEKKDGYEQRVSLDPKVTISRANGEKVAEGVMPFG